MWWNQIKNLCTAKTVEEEICDETKDGKDVSDNIYTSCIIYYIIYNMLYK